MSVFCRCWLAGGQRGGSSMTTHRKTVKRRGSTGAQTQPKAARDESTKKTRLLVPGTQDKGPQWEEFAGVGREDVKLSVTPNGVISEFDGGKLIVNPNAMIALHFDS